MPGRTRLKAASSSAAPHCSCLTCLSRSRLGGFPSPLPPFPYHEILLGLVGKKSSSCCNTWTCHVSPLTRRLGSKSDHKPLVTSSFSKVFSHTPHCLNRLSPHFTWEISSLSPEVLYSACRPPTVRLRGRFVDHSPESCSVHDCKTSTITSSEELPTASLRPERA